jgi:hypothetical protein
MPLETVSGYRKDDISSRREEPPILFSEASVLFRKKIQIECFNYSIAYVSKIGLITVF